VDGDELVGGTRVCVGGPKVFQFVPVPVIHFFSSTRAHVIGQFLIFLSNHCALLNGSGITEIASSAPSVNVGEQAGKPVNEEGKSVSCHTGLCPLDTHERTTIPSGFIMPFCCTAFCFVFCCCAVFQMKLLLSPSLFLPLLC
jgi:hypothetical protein